MEKEETYELIEDDLIIGSYSYFKTNINSKFLEDYLNEKFDLEQNFIKEEDREIYILDFINVEEEFQSQGYGNELLNHFLSKIGDSISILIADFKGPEFLVDWYESFEFEVIDRNKDNHYLMIYNK